MRSSDYFKDGRCVQCAKAGCDRKCLFYGRSPCIKTLLRVGEHLYLKGLDALGVKYYSLGIFAKDRIRKSLPQRESMAGRPLSKKKFRYASKPKKLKAGKARFESIEDRERRRQSVHDNLVAHGLINRRMGMFGIFAPKPVSRAAAMSFQRHSG